MNGTRVESITRGASAVGLLGILTSMVHIHHISSMKDISENRESPSAMIEEITRCCLLTRARRISRVITSIFDQELRPFEVSASQFSLLVLIARLESASRAEIARANHQERSTSTRNLNLLISQGWVEEIEEEKGGRRRPVTVSAAGRKLLAAAMPAWRSAQAKTKQMLGDEGAASVVELADGLPAEQLAA